MVSDRNKKLAKQPDIEQNCKVISNYIEYCIHSTKTKLTDKEKEGLSPEEISKREDEINAAVRKFDGKKKAAQKAFDSMCSSIEDNGIPYLKAYIEAAKRLYEEKPEWKSEIKEMLVNPKSLRLFRGARNNLAELYPLLIIVSKTFPVDDYPELSVNPRAAIYGSVVNKRQVEATKKSPLKNEDIQAMLDMFLQVFDNKRFGEWIKEILCFESSRMIDGFQIEYTPKREKLKEWVLNQVSTNEKYKRTLMNFFSTSDNLKNLLNVFASQSMLKAEQAELQAEIKRLKEANAIQHAENEKRRQEQAALNQEHDACITQLKNRENDFERCKQLLDEYIKRYQAQVDINERVVIEDERRLGEMKTEYSRMQEELSEAHKNLEAAENAYAALQSDFSLKNNELMRLRNAADQKEATARLEIMRELVSGINEQFFYLTMFYLDLRDNGKLEPENVELYADTLENIEKVLMGLGIKKIGEIDQKVKYDASIHVSTDTKIATGEQVTVSGYGWEIGDEVYIKAPVEKGE